MENERLARVEEQLKRLPKIEEKVDALSDKMSLWMGKILGAALVVEIIASIAMEWIRK
jgi:hypothetical protein